MNTAKKREREVRVRELIKVLKRLFPDVGIALQYKNTWELLVAVILSAQCTDKKVNEVTTELFKKYRSLSDYADADLETFMHDIRQTGFYRNKAKNIIAAAQKIRDEHGGEVPDTMEALTALPGVARKTANVVLGNAFDTVEGIAVDTHVKRFAQRFDLTDHDTPEKIERDLMEIIPKKDWFTFTYLVIEYGRHIAPARKYDTTQDPLIEVYPPAAKKFK